jgi:hypothetical protein
MGGGLAVAGSEAHSLPAGVTGTFRYNGAAQALVAGKQTIAFSGE